MMLRLYVILSSVLAANAFVTPSTHPFVGGKSAPSLGNVFMTHIDSNYNAGSGMTVKDIPLFIENLTPENFDESLEMLEPLLKNECVGEICDDYVGMLTDKAASIGMKVPAGYASTHH